MNSTVSPQASQRINVVDSLRGFAVVGIIVIHFLEHMNFYRFPDPSPFEQGLWDTVFFLGSNKMYGIFSLLFGLSCYIQHHNAEKRGEDFRLRFAWRMLLLFGWGLLDLVFFCGDILGTYAVLGLLLIPLVKASDKVLWSVAFLLLIQPIEVVYIILGIINPETTPMDLGVMSLWNALYDACGSGDFWDVASTNLTCGLPLNFVWAIEHGRFTQTLFLFVLGMIIGRRRLFLNEGSNLQTWKNVAKWSVFAFAVVQPMVMTIPGLFEDQPAVTQSLSILFTAWRNLTMVLFYCAVITLLYYRTGLQKALNHLNCIGKMSLTDYIIHSAVGGFLFYNWGLSLYETCSHGYSFILALDAIVFLYFFCHFWASHFRRGPLEEIWARLTGKPA